MSTGRTRLLAPLYLALLALGLLLLLRIGVFQWLSRLRLEASSQVRQTLLVQRQGEKLLSAALNEETGLRGYLLTRRAISLQPFETGSREFGQVLSELQRLLREDPQQLKTLAAIEQIHRRWLSAFAEPVLAGRRGEAQALAGKLIFDPLRDLVGQLQRREAKLLAEQEEQYLRIVQIFENFDLGAGVAVLFGIGGTLWFLRARVEQPLAQLTAASLTWREGKLENRIDYAAPGEIGRLAEVLNQMAGELDARQRQASERNRHLEDLIAALSHDLRTPLLANRTTMRSLASGAFGPATPVATAGVSDEWREIFAEMSQANEDLLQLVNNLLEVSRYEAGRKQLNTELLDWESLTAVTTAQVASAQPGTQPVRRTLAASLPPVYGDAVELRRVLQNLLDNALRVSPTPGSVEIAVDAPDPAQVRVRVIDQGPGISEAEQERLFRRFSQGRGRRGGAGLGLYLSRQIVQAHGGQIGVESEPGRGSTFWFALPTAKSIEGGVHV